MMSHTTPTVPANLFAGEHRQLVRALLPADDGATAAGGHAPEIPATVRELLPHGGAGIRAVLLLEAGHFLAAGEAGLFAGTLSGTLRTLGAEQGLPVADLTCLARGADGSFWIGSTQGLIRWRRGRWDFLSGPRWLPNDSVLSVVPDSEGGIRVETTAGAVRLWERRLTLETKADLLQADLEQRHRRHGFVTVQHLPRVGQLEGALQEISDNDGLWTAMYAAAQCFRFATTGASAAHAQAWRALEALLRLERITGLPGFPARALAHPEEAGYAERSPGEWHASHVEPGWMWKGDTSSDELDGHYFALYVAHELAADAAQKQRLQGTCRRITDHLLAHGYYLVDVDGQPTRWGVWAPERLNDDAAWAGERGLNSLEILSHLKIAHHLTGDSRYEAAYLSLVREHGYALNTLGVKVTTPGHINHSDDELAFLAYYPLLRLERDADLRAIYLAGLRRNWEFERPEACPLWNFIWGACSGEACDVEAAVVALQEMPLDLVNWPVRNSQRRDLARDPAADRFGKPQLLRPLSWLERPLHKWNGNPYLIDGGTGLEEEDQTVYLLPYWLGRYHGLI